MIRLSDSRQGDTVTVRKLEGSGAFRKRMLEMGIVRGTSINIVKYAPLKDPLEMVLKKYHLTLRVEEAEKVLVDTEPESGTTGESENNEQ